MVTTSALLLPKAVTVYEVFDVVETTNDGMPYSRDTRRVVGTFATEALALNAAAALGGPERFGFGVVKRFATSAQDILHADMAPRANAAGEAALDALIALRADGGTLAITGAPQAALDALERLGCELAWRQEPDWENGYAPERCVLTPLGQAFADTVVLVRCAAAQGI